MQKMSEKEMSIQQAINVMERYTDILLSKTVIQAHNMAIQALEDIQQYRAIGTIEELRVDKAQMMLKKYGSFSEMIDAVAAYSVIGTVEKCSEAVERMKPKKPIKEDSGCYDYDFDYKCPTCEEYIDDTADTTCCGKCGQAIDWEE